MPDYYIRTPDHDESRGPFDVAKLQTLGEAGKISENTLYYDEQKEEWLRFALNEVLKAEVFPKRDKLALKPAEMKETGAAKQSAQSAPKQIDVASMLAAAEGTSEETEHIAKRKRSMERAAAVGGSGLGLGMLLSAVIFIAPLLEVLTDSFSSGDYTSILNYPFLLVGFFDALIGIILFLAVTEVYPVLRGRVMLTVGFGIYLGWALGDPVLAACAVVGGVGLFLASVVRNFPSMIFALTLGVGGHAYLAFLSLSGRFAGFFEVAKFSIF